MDKGERELFMKEEIKSIKTEVDIKEEIVYAEPGICKEDLFGHENISLEVESLQVKDEVVDVSVKCEPLDFNDYEMEINECNMKNVGSLSVKQENSNTLENETKVPSTSGVKQKLKGKRSVKRCSSDDFEARKFEVSNNGNDYSNEVKGKKYYVMPSQMQKFKCSQCSYETIEKQNLNFHLLGHSDPKLFKCSKCSYKTNVKCNLERHLLSHSEVKLFKCSRCSYGTNRKARLNIHLLNHSGKKLFHCSHCKFETNWKRSLKEHLSNHFGTNNSSQCNFGSNSKELKINLLNHSGTKLFKCSHCNYGTNTKGNLKQHLLTHSGEKIFKCSECSYGTNEKRQLEIHLLDHSGKKMFHCSHCNFETNWKHSLRDHLLNHSEEKLFKCSHCNYGTNKKGNLKRHSLIHSAEKCMGRKTSC